MRPVIFVVMDGVGYGDGGPGDAVSLAKTPNLDKLLASCPNVRLKAHGTAVGLPSDDDMGNSEVGHNALGCGQIYAQGAKLVDESIRSGALFGSNSWSEVVNGCKGGTLHFIGLLSDGNVHSNISHLFELIKGAKKDGVTSVRVHILLDGRDVPATSALDYVNQLETLLAELGSDSFDCRIASGGGRMKITMDRYEADWAMVERGWNTHVRGIGRGFASASDAIETYRAEQPSIIDQDLPPFVITENNEPVGKIQNGDSVVLFNFRGDRALEICRAFDEKNFDKFDRGDVSGITFAGILEYDSDLKIPSRYILPPPDIQNTLSELLVSHGISQYAVSETQKYGHVTYFWNGNRSGKVSEELETFEEIASDNISFDRVPKMKSKEITDKLISAIESGKYNFLRCNFPNGDMVGHTGSLDATIVGVEAVDESLGRILEAAEKVGAMVIVTADHGNADKMLEKSKSGDMTVRTAHSLNPVPFILWDPQQKRSLKDGSFGLANCAATVAELFGITPPDCWEESMLG